MELNNNAELTLATARHKEDGGDGEIDTNDIHVCIDRKFIINGVTIFKWILFKGYDIRGIL